MDRNQKLRWLVRFVLRDKPAATIVFSLFIIHLFYSWFDFQDTILVIERYKSGFEPPGDFPFDDLSRGGESTPLILPGSGNTYVSSGVGAHRSESMTVKGTMSAGKLKKRVGLFAIFSSNKVYILLCIEIIYKHLWRQ